MQMQTDELKHYPGVLSIGINAHRNGNGSRRPAKLSNMPNLPAGGAKSRIGEPVRLGSQPDRSNACTEVQALLTT